MAVQKAIDISEKFQFEQNDKKILFTSNLRKMFNEIEQTVSSDEDESARSTGKILEKYIQSNEPLISKFQWPNKQDYYDRFLICGSKKKEIALMALIWPQNTFSPIHYHQAWCVFGIHSGSLTEKIYSPIDNNEKQLTQTATKQYSKNTWAHDGSDEKYYHKLGNTQSALAISFHVYGASPDNLHKINCVVDTEAQ